MKITLTLLCTLIICIANCNAQILMPQKDTYVRGGI